MHCEMCDAVHMQYSEVEFSLSIVPLGIAFGVKLIIVIVIVQCICSAPITY